MTHSFHIRLAEKADAHLILKFIQGIAAFEKLSHEVQISEEQILEHLFGAKSVAECFLAFEDQTAVGFALFFHNFSTFVGKPGIYLEDLYVEPPYRGKGYGKKLLEELVRTAKARNCGRVEWSVLNWNKHAINFYESMGAVAMDGWTVYRLSL